MVRDHAESPAEGLYSICYINGFQTQPGESDAWPQTTLLTINGSHVADPDWPDEFLLDTSTSNNREAILKVVSPQVEGCASAGFNAVEFDNLDSFTRSQGALSFEDNLALAIDLVQVAHSNGLAAGQKNAAEYSTQLQSEASFDFAIAEECAAYGECAAYTNVYGDAVIDVEYHDALPRSFAEMCDDSASPASMVLRDRDLLTPSETGYTFQTCE